MFDTIKMKINPVYINPNNLIKFQDQSFTAYENNTAVLNTTYKIKDKQLPYIRYYENSQTLVVELSIPKFLYGNNVTLLKEKDIPIFFQKLNERLKQLFGIQVNKEEWQQVERIDYCWNFQLGDQLHTYLKQLSYMNMPYKTPYNYGHDETVGFENKSSEIIFYDKHKECIHSKETKEIIYQAKGMLRFEVRPSYDDLKKCSPMRKATELLTKEFFKHFTDRVMRQITFPSTVEGLDYNWVKSQPFKISEFERVLAFRQMQAMFNDTELRGLYDKGTYDNRIKLSNKIPMPDSKQLAKLMIDYSNF
jgi:hypothetical protein